MDFPSAGVCPPNIASFSMLSGASAPIQQNLITTTGAGSSTVWPAANRGIYVPIILPAAFTLASFFSMNGSAVAGNIDMGLYGADGSLIVSKGSTAQAGTTTLQILTVTAVVIPPGRYYMAMSASSGSATVIARTPSVINLQRMGVLQAASQVPLATGPTLATSASTFLPFFGISQLTTY